MADDADFTATLDPATVKLYQRQFSFFDKDGDGKINAKELLQTLRALGRSASEATAKALIGDVDLDHDGVVNFSEFCRILEKNKAEGVDDVGIRKAFDHFRGGAEGISPEGLARVISEMGEKMSEEDIQEIFEAADTNNDGIIDYEEFKVLMAGRSMKGSPV